MGFKPKTKAQQQYESVVNRSVITSRVNIHSSPELREKLSEMFNGRGDENYPVHIFVSMPDFETFEKAGFVDVFKPGSNSITMAEARAIVMGMKLEMERFKNEKRRVSLAQAINRLIGAFGPTFARGVGGYAKAKVIKLQTKTTITR